MSSERATAGQSGAEDLPDYQDLGETAASGGFEVRPSTSRGGGEGTPTSDEPRDEDNGEDEPTGSAEEDYGQAESVSVGDDEADDDANEEDDDDDDVILVEVDAVSLTVFELC